MPGCKNESDVKASTKRGNGGRKTQVPPDAARARTAQPAIESGDIVPEQATILPVAGMVASAGGLGAFKAFFEVMPADNGIAFVLIPHLDPRHESLMAPLLAKHTSMPVMEARQGQRLMANHVYVIPPNRNLTLRDGEIQLSEPPAHGAGETAIDPFLQSLADDQQERAVCIILSGTGTHGSQGLKAVKAAGGMVMVQDPRTADYDRMPLSAVDTGLADYVLAPEEMPGELVRYVRHFVAGIAAQPGPAEAGDDLARILALLRARTKFDFRAYRKAMLMRRIQRRMGLNHLDRLGDYLPVLRKRQEEFDKLTRDLLINVTGFFRDPEMFQVLESQVLPELIGGHDADTSVRVWVPGCATGEEAYSIAMLLTERIAALGHARPVQVFATDVDQESLDLGRHGIYSETALAGLGHPRLERFFTKVDAQHWQVNKQLREKVLFAHQNVLADAPFSRMDLVSCRNLLIYLEPEVQHKLLQLFHFALNPEGYLVLGPSESVGRHVELYRPVSKKWRIFQKTGTARPAAASFPIQAGGRTDEVRPPSPPTHSSLSYLSELARKVLLDGYAPAAVVINRRHEVLHYSGPTHLYLQQPGGPPSHDLLSLVDATLRPRVRRAMQQAIREGGRCDIGGIRVQRGDRTVSMRIAAQPLEGKNLEDGLLLIAFQDDGVPPQEGASEAQPKGDELLVHQLEMEIKSTREELQSTIEELESSNEELKASNEEVMSMNEELQSTNEELETSKEELQSLNEELTTVNAQLRDKVDELEGVNNDMANLLASVDIATVFLGPDGSIKHFTPAATRLFNLIASDLGRPIGDITPRCEDPALAGDIDQVLQQLTPREKEVRGEGDRWYLRRVTPYRTADNRIDGLVLTFTDISLVKLADAALARERDLLESVLNSAGMAHLVYLDPDFNFVRANQTYAETCGYGPEEMIGKNHFALYPSPENEAIFRRVRDTGEAYKAHDKPFEFPDDQGRGTTYWDWTLIPVKDAEERVRGLIFSLFETTARVQAEAELKELAQSLEQKVAERTADLEDQIEQRREAEAALRASETRLRTIFQQAPIGITQADPANGCLLTVNPAYCAIVGFDEDELIGRPIADITHPEDREADREGFRQLSVGEIDVYQKEKRYIRKDGTIIWVTVSVSLVRDAEGRPLRTVAMIADISERRQLEEALDERRRQIAAERNFMDAVLETQASLLLVVDHEGNLVRFNHACEAITGFHLQDLQGSAGWWQLIPEEEWAAIEKEVLAVLHAGSMFVEHENHLICRDGSRRLIYWRNTALRDEAGHLQFVIGSGLDVTDLRRAEDASLEHLEEASRLQRVQTANELATLLAHELNQPLATIATYVEVGWQLLRKPSPDQDKLADNLERISQQAIRAGGIIRHLRSFISRARIDPAPMDLNQVVRSACNMMASQTRRSGIRLQQELDHRLPPALGADIHVEQVLLNLMRNAIEAIQGAGMEGGMVTIQTQRSGDMARVTVSDSGPGIDGELATLLFEPLSSRKPQGLGVGLRISRSLIETHKGRLWVEPKVPGGVFHFELPLAP